MSGIVSADDLFDQMMANRARMDEIDREWAANPDAQWSLPERFKFRDVATRVPALRHLEMIAHSDHTDNYDRWYREIKPVYMRVLGEHAFVVPPLRDPAVRELVVDHLLHCYTSGPIERPDLDEESSDY